MTMYCGTTPSYRLYCGTQSIGQVYCGETLAYGTEPTNDPTSVALTNLTISGTTPAGRHGAGMIGDETAGLIYGGNISGTITNQWYLYSVSGNTVTVTQLTQSGTMAARQFMCVRGSTTEGIVFSGQTSGGYVNEFFRYVIASGTVTVSPLTISGYTAIPARRFCNMVGDGDNGLIFGGNTSSGALNEFALYSRSGSTVTTTSLTLSGTVVGRYQSGMAGTSTEGIIFGGWTLPGGTATRSNTFYKYTRSGNTVTAVELTKTGATIAARAGVNMAGDATRGIIFGGNVGGSTPRVDDFYYYKVDGNNVNLTLLTETGYEISGRQVASISSMAGDIENGMIFGGRTATGWSNEFVTYAAT